MVMAHTHAKYQSHGSICSNARVETAGRTRAIVLPSLLRRSAIKHDFVRMFSCWIAPSLRYRLIVRWSDALIASRDELILRLKIDVSRSYTKNPLYFRHDLIEYKYLPESDGTPAHGTLNVLHPRFGTTRRLYNYNVTRVLSAIDQISVLATVVFMTTGLPFF